MPYMIEKKENEFCVYKKGSDDKPTGDSFGCHPTEKEAQDQIAALYASEKSMSINEYVQVIRDKIRERLLPDKQEIVDIWVEEVYADYVITNENGEYYKLPYIIDENQEIVLGEKQEVEKAWQTKSECLYKSSHLFIKATGDWELDVLGIPFGNINNKDSDGEFFSEKTNLYLDKFSSPLIVYQHGYDKSVNGIDQMPKPEIIGEAKSYSVDERGVWWRVALDKTNEYAKKIWEAAKNGLARASSGTVSHLMRKNPTGEITDWPVAEISLLDRIAPANNYALALPVLKSHYQQAGKDLPEIQNERRSEQVGKAGEDEPTVTDATIKKEKGNKMDPKEVEKVVQDALKAHDEQLKAEAEAKAKIDADIKAAADKAVEDAKAEWEKEAAKSRRLPFGQAPEVLKFSKIGKYDYIPAEDLALGVAVLKSQGKHVPNEALQSIAVRFASADKPKTMEQAATQNDIKMAMAEAGMSLKSDEIMQQDLTSYGDEWVAAGYSPALWEKIRTDNPVLDNIPQEEIPRGYESMKYLLESTDPTFYKVAEVEDENATTGTPDATVTSSKVGTADQDLSLAKMGARVSYSGELNEDSLIPISTQIPNQIVMAGKEQLEHVIIDGDTTETQYLNINDVGGTPAGTEAFLLIDGFRHLALVTNTANSRSASGGLEDTDYLETAKMLGAAGINADITKCGFIIDKNVYWKSLALAEVKTKDVFSNATLEGGQLKNIWGFPIIVSNQMCRMSASRLSQSNGWVDQDTTTDNLYGSILCVRWDQWKFGWKRRMTLETTRIPRADVTEIVALMRFGLIYRDTEAAALSYYVGI